MTKPSIFKEFWDFMRVRKKWWLTPILVFVLLLAGLLLLTRSSALAPFVYGLF